MSSNTTSSSCPRSGFWSPPSAPWFLRRFSAGFQRSLPRPTHPPSFAPIAGRLLTLLRLGGAPASIFSATLRPQTLSTAAHLLEFSGIGNRLCLYIPALRRVGTTRILTHEFSEPSRHSQIPSFFLRLFGILTEIDFARLSSPAFIHIMRTLEDSRAEFRTRPARAGPRETFGTLLDPD